MNEGYHSLIFADLVTPNIFVHPDLVSSYRHTWDSWHLVPSSRPVFIPPPVKELYQDVPGSDSSLDYTESLTGYPLYGNREGSQEFWVLNENDDPTITDYNWSVLYSEIMNYLHGRRKIVILEDDPGYYYEGRWKVNEWKSDKERSIITLDYNLYPYKMEVQSTLNDWLWDPFSFVTGIIREYGSIDIEPGTDYTIELDGSIMPSTPIITLVPNSNATVVQVSYKNAYGVNKIFTGSGTTLAPTLTSGNNRFPDMIIQPDRKTLKFRATGDSATIKIDFKGGIL